MTNGERSDREGGSATVVGIGAIFALMVVFAVGLHLGSAVITRHRAEAAADLAALAAAAHAVEGAPAACAHARRVADRMAVRLTACEMHGWEVSVRVEAAVPAALARFGTAQATARAGPAATGPAAGFAAFRVHDERSSGSDERPPPRLGRDKTADQRPSG